MPRPSNTDERRAQIVAGMRHVIAKVGYERASVADIAKAARLTPGLVHYHFKSKLEILEVLTSELVRERAAQLRDKLASAGAADRALDVFIDHYLRPGKDADPEALACWIVLSAEALREPKIKRAVALSVHETVAQVEDILRAGIAAKVFKKSDTGAAAAALVALIQGYYIVAATAEGATPRGTAAETAKKMMRGLLR
ncbi:MAG: TetR family transcriptional regulator C-terminal domain-containing protein [Deltaproteobacteria bacterium]|nr:TetR family transcriptional regulator C-terminal domain-containing protein [Deltaproteobacteria bacterium]